MSRKHAPKSRPDVGPTKHGAPSTVAAVPPAAPVAGPVPPPEQLTPEEQMERFAKELKNEDWGHQPC